LLYYCCIHFCEIALASLARNVLCSHIYNPISSRRFDTDGRVRGNWWHHRLANLAEFLHIHLDFGFRGLLCNLCCILVMLSQHRLPSIGNTSSIIEFVTFVTKQPNLCRRATFSTVISDDTVASNHAVARHEQRPRIHRHYRTNGPARSGMPRFCGQPSIRHCSAESSLTNKRAQYLRLEGS